MFDFEKRDPLQNAGLGGGPSSYVDQKSIRLPDGRVRIYLHDFVDDPFDLHNVILSATEEGD